MHRSKAVVIGSGVAGLATSIRLAIQGYDVSVFEKNSYPGGKITRIEKEGYRFDAGPSLFTEPANIEELFDLAGEPIAEYFTYSSVVCGCTYFFENGKIVRTWSSPEMLVNEFADKLGADKQQFVTYLRQSQNRYNTVGSIFLNQSLHQKKTWKDSRIFKSLSATNPALLFSTLNNYNRRRFKNAETVQVLNRFATYNGSNPYQAPGMLSLISHLELNGGVHYPQGGMISITNALYRLALKKGVQFFFNTPVQRIIYTSNEVKGVVAQQKNVFAEVVVSNADIYFTYKNLLENQYKAIALSKQEKSSSAVVFYWGIKKRFTQLGLHNVFFSNDYKEEFRYIFDRKEIYNDPTVYINITSKMEDGHAPGGKENWFVMINAPENIGQDWGKIKAATRAAVLQKLKRLLNEDVESLIEVEEILDPVSLEANTGAYKGALYGNASNSKWAAFMRHPNFTRKVRGLYFCGGTVHPGGGIPLCLRSARIVAGLVQDDFKRGH